MSARRRGPAQPATARPVIVGGDLIRRRRRTARSRSSGATAWASPRCSRRCWATCGRPPAPSALGRVAITTGCPDRTAWPDGIAYGPQEQSLFAELSVEENLLGRRRAGSTRTGAVTVLAFFPVLGTGCGSGPAPCAAASRRCWRSRGARDATGLIAARRDHRRARAAVPVVDNVAHGAARAVRRHGLLLVEQNIDLDPPLADRVAVLKLGPIVFEREATAPGLREELTEQLAP